MTYAILSKVHIRNIKEIHAGLAAYVRDAPAVEIDLSGCEDVDLSLVQLIESARKTATTMGKDIALVKPANDVVQSVLRRAGMIDNFTSDDAKFWLHKGMQ